MRGSQLATGEYRYCFQVRAPQFIYEMASATSNLPVALIQEK